MNNMKIQMEEKEQVISYDILEMGEKEKCSLLHKEKEKNGNKEKEKNGNKEKEKWK